MIKKVLTKLLKRIRPWSTEDKVRWFGAKSVAEAAKALTFRAKAAIVRTGGQVLVVADGGQLEEKLLAQFGRDGIDYQLCAVDSLSSLKDVGRVAVVVCAALDARIQTQAAVAVASHSVLRDCPFESVAGLDDSVRLFDKYDEYRNTTFVSPVLLASPTPYQIYEQSLEYFEQKCGLRDYLDLYQLLKSIVDSGIEGDIAEFGSFRGHSGWLMARTLQALGSDKQLYMFDTFESFPAESYGVDHFWSATHPVDYEAVRAKFADMPSVTLVKGDFTKTLETSPVKKLALAYIDCDSYRATRYLLAELPRAYTTRNAVMVCEDYGHPALLGNRAAVHEICDQLPGWFRFFSQFSGLYILVNLGNTTHA